MWCMFFGAFQCLPVNDCPAASYDSGVLAKKLFYFHIHYLWSLLTDILVKFSEILDFMF